MTFTFDAKIEPILSEMLAARQGIAVIDPRDVNALRSLTNENIAACLASVPHTPDVVATDHTIAVDGGSIVLTWYRKKNASSGAAVVYVHGGGMIAGSVALYDKLIRHYVDSTDTPFLAVGYRLAPEHRREGLAQDVLVALRWLFANAEELGVENHRIAIMGDSGGGGVAAAAAVMARDNGLELAHQILIYPMLDNRNIVPDPLMVPFALWNYNHNASAWSAVLGDFSSDDAVSPYFSPARLKSFLGLASAFIEVGELDIFRDESIEYACQLLKAGVSCALHVVPGAPHVFEWMAPNSGASIRAREERFRVIKMI